METVVGRVESVGDETVTVVVDSPVACQRCASGKGCGAGLLASGESLRRIDVASPPGMRFAIGDAVTLSISPRQLLRAASIAYGVPLASLVTGAGLAWLSGAGQGGPWAIGFAIAGLGTGIVVSRRLLRRDRVCEQFVPGLAGGQSS
jgi:sigma-E factor negative regulatory protein RseC